MAILADMRSSWSLIAIGVGAGAVGVVASFGFHQPALAIVAVLSGLGTGCAQRNVLLPRWLYGAGGLIAAAALLGSLAGSHTEKRLSALAFAFGVATVATVFMCRAQHNPYPGVGDGPEPTPGTPAGDRL